MWCWCSNVVMSTTPCFKALVVPSVPATSLPQSRHRPSVSASSLSQSHHHHGHVTTNFESNSKPEKQEISGSDILWALQRATTRKKIIKKSKKKEPEHGRDSSSAVSSMEESSMEYHVQPLCINEDWGTKLDELENRLRNLSDST